MHAFKYGSITKEEYIKQTKNEKTKTILKPKLEINAKFNTSSFYLNDNNFGCKSPFNDQSLECNELNDKTIHNGHRMFDLHGYTMNGSEQALRKIFTSIDRSKQQIVKINVGTGSHSHDKIAKLPKIVLKVANDLQLPPPIKHEKNPGYLIMILPPIVQVE